MLLLLLTVSVTLAGPVGAYSVQGELRQLEEQIQKLDQKIDGIANDVKRLDQVSDDVGRISEFTDKLDAALASIYGGKEAGLSLNTEPSDDSNILPVTIQKLRRKELGDGKVRYGVHYTRNVDEVVCTGVNSLADKVQLDITNLEDNIDEVSATVNKSLKVTFVFSTKNFTSTVMLRMGNPLPACETDSESEIVLTASEVETLEPIIDPPKELVYEEREDAKFTFTFPNSSWVIFRPYVYDIDRRETFTFYDDLSKHTDLPEKLKKISGGEEATVTLKTSERRLCGLLEFTVAKEKIGPSILKSLYATGRLVLRPSTQDHPFPDDVLGFMDSSNYNYGEEDGAQIFMCRADEKEKCRPECRAFGGRLEKLEILRVSSDGTLSPMEVDGLDADYLKHGYFQYSVPDVEHIDAYSRFICKAYSSNGLVATAQIHVVYVIKPHILENGTSAQLNSDGDEKRLDLKCTSTGKPLPNITFEILWEHDDMYDGIPDQMETTADGKFVTAYKTVTWRTDENKGDLIHVSCKTSTKFDDYDYRYIEILE